MDYRLTLSGSYLVIRADMAVLRAVDDSLLAQLLALLAVNHPLRAILPGLLAVVKSKCLLSKVSPLLTYLQFPD